MRKPNFFIVGAPKCGTTAMNDYLSQHPDIFMAKKEPDYFCKDLKIKIKLSESEYMQYFQAAKNEKIIGEASVWYLISKISALDIKKFAPDAKILIMLRNPVDVIYALHSQNIYEGNEDVLDFKTALNLDESRRNGKNLPDSADFFELPLYSDSVLFYEQVKRYLDVFGKNYVHIILYDNFKMDTKKVVSETLEFLGIDNRLPIDYNIINPNKRIKWFRLHRLIKRPGSAIRTVFRIIVPVRRLRHFIMLKVSNWNIKTGKRTKMNDKLYESLKRKYAADVKLLANLINRDLSAWL